MHPLDLVKLSPLMDLTSSRLEVVIGLIDGSVLKKHPELADANIREISGELSGQWALLHESVLRMGVIMVGLNRQTQP
jgi:hypothetical protein